VEKEQKTKTQRFQLFMENGETENGERKMGKGELMLGKRACFIN
jgi:hypothetical protein